MVKFLWNHHEISIFADQMISPVPPTVNPPYLLHLIEARRAPPFSNLRLASNEDVHKSGRVSTFLGKYVENHMKTIVNL